VRIDVAGRVPLPDEVLHVLPIVRIALWIERDAARLCFRRRCGRRAGGGRARRRRSLAGAGELHHQARFPRRPLLGGKALTFGLGLLRGSLCRVGGGIRGHDRHNAGLALMLEDRPAEIAGKRRPKLRYVAIATRIRRPLTEREKEWRSRNDKDWRWENQDTDELIFEIKTWLPGDLPRTWKDGARQQLETLMNDIFITMVAAFPMLAAARERREEAERQRQIEERRRYEEEQRRKLEHNRFRCFLEFAQQWRDAQLARDFIVVLRAHPLPADQEIAGNSLSDWLGWLERYADRHDPSRRDAAQILEAVAAVHSWTYRD
jgi:hypothetical protein